MGFVLGWSVGRLLCVVKVDELPFWILAFVWVGWCGFFECVVCNGCRKFYRCVILY